jgi:hypothetical protein
MHFTGAPYANFAALIATCENAMRLINRAMGEREIVASRGRSTASWPRGGVRKFSNCLTMESFSGWLCMDRKKFRRRLSGHEKVLHTHLIHLSDSHRNLHLLTRFYCALKLPQLPSNKAEGSLLMRTTCWIIEKV